MAHRWASPTSGPPERSGRGRRRGRRSQRPLLGAASLQDRPGRQGNPSDAGGRLPPPPSSWFSEAHYEACADGEPPGRADERRPGGPVTPRYPSASPDPAWSGPHTVRTVLPWACLRPTSSTASAVSASVKVRPTTGDTCRHGAQAPDGTTGSWPGRGGGGTLVGGAGRRRPPRHRPSTHNGVGPVLRHPSALEAARTRRDRPSARRGGTSPSPHTEERHRRRGQEPGAWSRLPLLAGPATYLPGTPAPPCEWTIAPR